MNSTTNIMKIFLFSKFFFVPEARVELARPCGRQILSLLGLPFPHSGIVIENRRISVVTSLKSHRDDIPHHQAV